MIEPGTWLDLLGPLAAAVSAILGGVWAMGRTLIARVVRELEHRLDSHDDRLAHLDAEFRKLLADLPAHYQQREDAIREYTAINAKLDRLYELMLREKT